MFSSVGGAPLSQSGGHRFEPCITHGGRSSVETYVAEQRTVDPPVAGSNPVARPSLFFCHHNVN